MQPEPGGRSPAWEAVRREGVRMLTVMVSAMVVAASLFYYWGRPQQFAERNSAGASRASKEAGIPTADSVRPDASAVAAESALRPDPQAVAPQSRQATETGESVPAKAMPAASLPTASAVGEAKSGGPPKTSGTDAAEPGKDRDPKPVAPSPDKPPIQAPSIVPQETPADRQQHEKYRRGVAEIRTAMGKRDLIGAKLLIRSVAAFAQTPQQAAEIARLDALIGHLREFWRLMAQAAANLQPAQEFTVGGIPVIVVEAGPTQLTLRSEGRNQTVQVKSLPRPLVDGVVEAGFPDNPASKVLYGAFHAFDPQGDRRLARTLWQQAIDAGQKIEDLLAELDAVPVAAGGKSGPGPGAIAKTDVPTDPAALEKAERQIRAQFEVDYNLATSGPGRLKLVEKLVEAAGGPDVAPESRFIMLRDARDHALAAGKPELACEVVDQLGRCFTIDPLEMKVAAVEQAAKSARTSKSNKELAECALGFVEYAAQVGRLDAAARLADVSLSAAQRSRNAALVREAQEAKQKVDEMTKRDADGVAKKKRK